MKALNTLRIGRIKHKMSKKGYTNGDTNNADNYKNYKNAVANIRADIRSIMKGESK